LSAAPVRRTVLVAYALLAFPLAMAALPVYVHVPKFYAGELGLSLGTVGVILLAARSLDALQDPFLGWWSDRVAASGGDRSIFVACATALLALGFLGLLRPPAVSGSTLAAWLAGALLLCYSGFSMATISYFAIGAELSDDYHERTRITAARAVAGIAGVVTASALPELLAGTGGLARGLATLGLLYVPVLLIGVAALLFGVSAPRRKGMMGAITIRGLAAPLADRRFRWLLAVFILSGVASAIPATLVLFFIQDVLGRNDLSGWFLGIYFLFGAIGMPLWVVAARRVGKRGAWVSGMVMSIVAFVWAFLLGQGDVVGFGMVCALSGIAYGAELALPPSILADLAGEREAAGEARGGAYFGFWQLSEKLNLALAAGTALPLLGLAGYVPGTPQAARGDLSSMYALAPCALKGIALMLLWIAPVEVRVRQAPAVSGGCT